MPRGSNDEDNEHGGLLWPENDPSRPQNIFRKIMDRLFYPYMKTVLKRGAILHNERSLYNEAAVDGDGDGDGNDDSNDNGEAAICIPKELSQKDLFQSPPHMRADFLQQKFQNLHAKRLEEMRKKAIAKRNRQIKKQSNKRSVNGVVDVGVDVDVTGVDADSDSDSDSSTVKLSRKVNGWILIRTLWDISKPTYIYAGWAQLVTVLIQAFNPLAVQYLLKLVERHPDENVFGEGVGFAIALFLCAIVDGIAQERQKFLAFQSGITIRTATVSVIYHHMLNLSSKGKQHLLMGETTNLVAIDCQKLFEVCQEGHLLWSCPLSMIIVTVLLLITLGPATLVGMTSMFLLVPLVKMVVEKMMIVRKKRAVYTDKRVDTTTAMLQAIRFCKLNHYEQKFLDRVNEARKKEMVWVRKELSLIGVTMAMTVLSPVLAAALTFIAYALMNGGNVLTPSDTFTALLLFSALRFPINYAGKLMGKAAQGIEACERIGHFLDRDATCTTRSTNDISVEDNVSGTDNSDQENTTNVLLEVKNGSFTVGAGYKNDDEGTNENVDPGVSGHSVEGKATFTLSGINLSVKRGETLACVGPVGSGKSTLLHALVGDVAAGSSDIVMRGSIAYASQSPFILNATLRDNILFGLDYNQDLYDRVIEACNLLPDLKQLGPSRDLTEIGERGVTLSGGQKARISLARCVYSQPSIALFDDILSALDASTGKWIFERLFESSNVNGSNLLSKSAVVLVTHASHFLSRVDKILVLVKGNSAFIGNWNELLSIQPEDQGAREVLSSICSSVQERDENIDTADQSKDTKSSSSGTDGVEQKDGQHGILMTEEERDFGLSDWRTWVTWFKLAGGIIFIVVILICLLCDRGFYVATEWWLASWTSAATDSIDRFGITFAAQSEGLSAQYEFIKFFSIILIISFVATFARSQILIRGGARSAEKLFNDMTARVIHAPMSYFETTPMGRILNRLTYDVEILDITLSTTMTFLLTSSGWFVTGVVIIITILPWNVLILVPIVVLYWLLLLFYRKSSVDLQRLDALSRSPVQANLSEGIDGSTTIKAFGKIDFFEQQFRTVLDNNASAMMNFMAAQRWLGTRFQVLGSFVVLFATLFVVSYNSVLTLETGLIAMLIIWTYNFTITLAFFSQAVSESEAYLTSVERARDMADLPQESDFETKSKHKPNATWPSDGNLIFDDVCLRYRPGLPLALKNLSFTVTHGQRVGICGRTGAGKSTIAVALFRLAELDSGRIILDGLDLSKLGLGDVRGRKKGMCIIPQDPVLFSGSLRECLDPWGQSSDEEILEALRSVKVADAEERRMQALDDYVDEGGRNFSAGERQLICLARAVLSQPTVLVLDEATASVDGETDVLIQKMIRSRFKGTTLLTIAHRLNTIMDYDVIIVMDKGKVAEFGSPRELLRVEDGLFSDLVDSTGKESSLVLRQMVQHDG